MFLNTPTRRPMCGRGFFIAYKAQKVVYLPQIK
jgi:hypothetical protein